MPQPFSRHQLIVSIWSVELAPKARFYALNSGSGFRFLDLWICKSLALSHKLWYLEGRVVRAQRYVVIVALDGSVKARPEGQLAESA